MPKAYSYLRFSSSEQAKGDSHRRQTHAAADYAKRQGLELDTELTFQDLGVSAFRGANAETGMLGEFLRAVHSGVVEPGSLLLVESLDRISRQTAWMAFGTVTEIIKAGITLVTLIDERQYSAATLGSDPMALMFALLTLIRANEESETKSRRLSASWEAKRAKAEHSPMTSLGPAWLRYDRDAAVFVVIPERAEVVRGIFSATLEGVGKELICRKLNAEGVPVFGAGGRKGKHWHVSYVAKILKNPAVVGTLIPHKQIHDGTAKRRKALEPVPNYYPAIIDLETFERTQRMREGTTSPRRGRHAAAPVRNIFGGLGRCPRCGATMTRITKGKKWHYLVCTKAKAGAGCKYELIRYAEVERAFVDDLARIVGECPTPKDNGLDDRINEVGEIISVLCDQLEALADAVAGRPGHVETLVARMRDKEAEREQLGEELRDLERQRADLMGKGLEMRLRDLVAACEAEPLDRTKANASLRTVLREVVPDRENKEVRLVWKHGGESSLQVVEWVFDDEE